ncbi:uncharacterized protein LOC8272989 isoform X2 [Ricinus communis]|uniref:uncharacterized protein LOC8272989 isoform X2 n=1 Tax=Ricinus communis TaxID=3988 RepID=UPI00201A5D27|nr:uncharacterized protein LOC8272989 isoform X2 [Ricinus communis]
MTAFVPSVTWAGDSFYGTCSFQQYEFWIFLFHFASCCLFLIFVDPDTSGEAISLADYTFGIVSVCKFPSRPVQSFKQIYTFLKPFQLLIPTVSHFPLFVLTPDRLAHGLRDSIASGIFCLVLAVFLLVIELRDIGGVRSCGCNIYCFFYSLAIGFLFYFTIMYLSLAIW